MTHAILQSDIDLAQRLLAEGLSEESVVSALERRGIELYRAAQLVSDLRQGAVVEAETAAPELAEEAAIVAFGSVEPAEHAPSALRDRPEHRERSSLGARLLIGGLLVCFLGVVGAVVVPYYVKKSRERKAREAVAEQVSEAQPQK
jgi:hypothetical protein